MLLRNHTCRIVLHFCLAPIRNSQQAVEVNWTSEKLLAPDVLVEFVHFDRSCIVQREHIYCGSTVPNFLVSPQLGEPRRKVAEDG